ncbi:MAG: preprotein translocase subunit YajC [Bdellovibrionota bacterium]
MDFSLISTAYAQTQGQPQPSMVEMLILPLGFLFILYFFMIRPQAKKARDHQALLKELKIGDEVITTGGIIGRIKSIADSFVTIEVNGAAIKIIKEHVVSLTKQLATDSNQKKVKSTTPAT